VIREDVVGSARSRICYPNISSCISVTAVTRYGLAGTHISVGTKLKVVDQVFEAMRAAGAGGCREFHVVGAIARYEKIARAINTRLKIEQKIQSAISPDAAVRFFDTSDHGNVHVFVEQDHSAPVTLRFSWTASVGNHLIDNQYREFSPKYEIDPNEFV